MLWSLDHIVRDLSIPISVKKSLDKSYRQLLGESDAGVRNLVIRDKDFNSSEDCVYGCEVIPELIEGSGEV